MPAFHESLNPLLQAAEQTRCGWRCLPVPLSPTGGLGWAGGKGLAALRHKAFLLRQHVVLALRCWSCCGRPILVREFSTLPLCLVAPLLWPLRRRLYFLVNHNLQWTVANRWERWGFMLLARLGFRYVFFESVDLDVLKRYRLPAGRHRVLPHPVPAWRVKKFSNLGSALPVIGLPGHYRPEKGMDAALAALLVAGTGRWRVVVGVPNKAEVLPSSPLHARAKDCEWRDTSTDAAYRGMLADCDVVVLNYRPADYAFRPSGLLADAAAAGTAVVIPDLPVSRQQLMRPTPVGEVFASPEEMIPAVERALAKVQTNAYDFAAYCAARSVPALAAALDALAAPDRPELEHFK